MFQIAGREVLFEWMSKEGDRERRLAMLEWLAVFADHPLAGADRVPGVRAPVFIVIVPLRPTPALVRFLYAEQFRTVKIIDIRPMV